MNAGRGLCPECGAGYALTKLGRVRKHRAPDSLDTCGGSGQAPQPVRGQPHLTVPHVITVIENPALVIGELREGDVLAPGAVANLPADVPLSFGGIGGPVIGTAHVSVDGRGIRADMTIDDPAALAVLGGAMSFSLRPPPPAGVVAEYVRDRYASRFAEIRWVTDAWSAGVPPIEPRPADDDAPVVAPGDLDDDPTRGGQVPF